MNANFQVRKVTGYDPGYPRARRRPGRLEARPLKFLFLVVGFLFFFVGVGCEEKVKTTGGQMVDDDSLMSENEQPDGDAVQPDFGDLQGVTDPDFPLDDAVPDYSDQLGGVDISPDYDIEVPDYDDQLAGELMPDADELTSDELLPDGDNIVCPIDEELSGVVAPDSELPDEDDPLAGDPVPVRNIKR